MKNTFAVTMTLLLALTIGGSVVGYNIATTPHHSEKGGHGEEKGGHSESGAPMSQEGPSANSAAPPRIAHRARLQRTMIHPG